MRLLAPLCVLVAHLVARGCQAAPSPGSFLTPSGIYYDECANGGLCILAPDVELDSEGLLRSEQAESLNDCAAACWAEPQCAWFDYHHCEVQDGCIPDAKFNRCRMFAAGCTVAPTVAALVDVDGVEQTAGFPVRDQVSNMPNFAAQPGQGVLGSDLQCEQETVLPGKCAMRSIVDAVVRCATTPECHAVVHYLNGTDGCSEPVSLLTTIPLTTSASFVSPFVATLSKLEENSSRTFTVFDADATVVLPSDTELAALGNSAISNTTAWLGCFIASNTIMAGSLVAVLDGIPSAEACCRACRNGTRCNVWNYCSEAQGCSYLGEFQKVALEARQCELRYSEASDVASGLPPVVTAKGTKVPFVGGAPLQVYSPPLPGFQQLPGRTPFGAGGYPCSHSIMPSTGECMVVGTPEQLGENCRQDPQCAGVVVKPGWKGQPEGTAVGILKKAVHKDTLILTPTETLYVKEAGAQQPGSSGSGDGTSADSDSDSGGLSAGAIAGVVVGAAVAAAVLATAGWLLLQRRRRGQRAVKSDAGSRQESGANKAKQGGDGCSEVVVAGPADTDVDAATAGSGTEEAIPTPSSNSTGAVPVSPFAAAAAAAAARALALRGTLDADSAGGVEGAGSGASPMLGSSDSAKEPTPNCSEGLGSIPGTTAGGGTACADGDDIPNSARRTPGTTAAAMGSGRVVASVAWAPQRSLVSPGAIAVSPFAAASRARLAQSGRVPSSVFAAPSTTSSLQGSRTLGPSVEAPANSMGASTGATGGSMQPSPAPAPATGLGAGATSAAGGSGSGGGAVLPGLGTASSAASSRHSTGSEHSMLPELAQHVRQCDAAIAYGVRVSEGRGGGVPPLLTEHSIISTGSLPDSLRDWVVDIEDISFVCLPNGMPQELGSGASATVYKAKFRGETVAAKEVDLGRSRAVQELFVTEAERLHQLRHAHVVALYGVALSGPRGVLLMEYCSGRDLTGALQLKYAGSTQKRLFGWYGRGRHVALDIAKALNFLHAKGVVHMDVKSSNVLLTGTATAKLADVGVARLQRGTFISDMPAVGTFAWMAPEVITGQRCTSAVDIFSFGVVLWEIVTGERPHRGSMRLPLVPEECPQDVADLINHCMALDPAGRPTAQQLMEQLEVLQRADSCRSTGEEEGQ